MKYKGSRPLNYVQGWPWEGAMITDKEVRLGRTNLFTIILMFSEGGCNYWPMLILNVG